MFPILRQLLLFHVGRPKWSILPHTKVKIPFLYYPGTIGTLHCLYDPLSRIVGNPISMANALMVVGLKGFLKLVFLEDEAMTYARECIKMKRDTKESF